MTHLLSFNQQDWIWTREERERLAPLGSQSIQAATRAERERIRGDFNPFLDLNSFEVQRLQTKDGHPNPVSSHRGYNIKLKQQQLNG